MLSIQEIQQIIPHRFPLLLVDQVLELEPGKRIVALKNVSINEWFFQGHFPGFPIMPGVLIIEALAQAGAVLALSEAGAEGLLPLFAGIDNCRFKSQVGPGDSLRLEVGLVSRRRQIGRAHARATVGERLAAEADLTFALVKSPVE